jgi:hypothetical protein
MPLASLTSDDLPSKLSAAVLTAHRYAAAGMRAPARRRAAIRSASSVDSLPPCRLIALVKAVTGLSASSPAAQSAAVVSRNCLSCELTLP